MQMMTPNGDKSEWMGQLLDDVEEKARVSLLGKCKEYREAVEIQSRLQDEHPFISALADRNDVTEERTFSQEELQALVDFMAAEDDIRYYMWIELYAKGYRDCLVMLGQIGVFPVQPPE